LVLITALFVFVVGASNAQAAFGIAEWQGVTCKENVDTPAEVGPPPKALTGAFPLPDDPEQCNAGTPTKWFTQAAGHPNFGITDFTLNTFSTEGAKGFPEGFVKDIIVDTPEGLSVNPEATPVKCTEAQLKAIPSACPLGSLVGFNYLTVAGQAPPCAAPIPGNCLNVRAKIPVFNMVPDFGVPSAVGFPTNAPEEPTLIVGSLDPEDQHVTFTISNIHPPDGTPAHPPIIASRLVFNGKAGDGTYLTMPSNCAGGQTSRLNVDQQTAPGTFVEASSTTPFGGEGCENVPFEPTINVDTSGATDSPEPASLDIGIPFDSSEPIANSYLEAAKVTLPDGAGINPSLANGLTPCTDEQFHKGTNDPIECPEASEIGTTEVQTPSLPPNSLSGTVYVAQPLSNEAGSGNQFRIFLHVFSDRYGVNVRLLGKVFPNPQTGQLTILVEENPQATFSSFKVNIDGGPKGALTTPGDCGPHNTSTDLTPWSGAGNAAPNSEYSLASLPGGGPCPKTLGARPFAPAYSAGTQTTKAGAYSTFEVHVKRPDGAQEIKRLDDTLPPGMLAKLKGLEYCPDASIEAARGHSGASELASPSCPANSLIGTVGIDAGSGPAPFHTDGKAYFAGPYKGAPVSFVVITPAVAGPYDLGTVVVRVALNIDPETAVVKAISDAIPDVFGGVKLDIRSIDASINRQGYTVNPTTCREEFAVTGELFGGGEDPANPGAWFLSKQEDPFRATECSALKFKPKFFARITGGKSQTKRTAHPKFQGILEARTGDANLRRAAFILPRATILDQGHIKTICTRVQLESNSCPSSSVYGHANASSPLLDGKLKGPVYLTPSRRGSGLPDLLVNLKGQINIRLRGEISSVQNGRLKTVFFPTPDAAVNKFVLNMDGGKKGLLVNSVDLCAQKKFGSLNLKAQNSRQLKNHKLQLNIPACNKP
jgi:hypothetical protein